MSTRPSRQALVLGSQAAELAWAVPQVVAHRLTRLALAGPLPSARDRKEFEGMVQEKQQAFSQAWQAMAVQTLRAQQQLGLSFLQQLGQPMRWRAGLAPPGLAQLQRAALGILGQGLAPVHRKAVANAKRLARTRLR